MRNYEKAEKLCPKCNCIIDESEDPNQPQDFFIENKKQHQFRLPKRIDFPSKNCNFRDFILGLFRGKNNINDFESLIKCQTDKCGICGDDLSYMKE